MKKEQAGDVIVLSELTDEQWITAQAEARARNMGHGFGQNKERGFYVELMPENRTEENLAALEAALGG